MTRYFLLFDIYGLVFCGAPSLTRGRVCLLYMLLTLASEVFLGSESLGTRDHILLSQTRDFPFRRLLLLVGSRWRYSTPPPHGSLPWSFLESRYIAAARTTQKSQFYCKNHCVTQQLVTDNPVPTVAWRGRHRKHSFLYCCLMYHVFIELLPSNALIKCVTLQYTGYMISEFITTGERDNIYSSSVCGIYDISVYQLLTLYHIQMWIKCCLVELNIRVVYLYVWSHKFTLHPLVNKTLYSRI
jgi:hypothetical protein